ncbi:MAG: hypothetical protein U1D69_00935, partial [Polynucleobacter sp.]|nr:hypothetical protein [Polynucleobacter sp.]
DEFLVSATQTGNNGQIRPASGIADNGDFAVAWFSWDSLGTYSQRFNAQGNSQGSLIQLAGNTSATFHTLAMARNGDFVMGRNKHSLAGIYAQRYNAQGEPQGTEFRANTDTSAEVGASNIAFAENGDFVVVWESGGWSASGLDGDGIGLFARRYNAQGEPQGTEFQVNSETTFDQSAPKIAMNGAGDFVITWESGDWSAGTNGPDGDTIGVFARRFNALGEPQGDEFQVNNSVAGGQIDPAVAMAENGDFVITWMNHGGSPSGIYARRYNAQGTPLGGEFPVSIYSHSDPAIAMAADGRFVISWGGNNPQDGYQDVFARCYDPAGNPIVP